MDDEIRRAGETLESFLDHERQAKVKMTEEDAHAQSQSLLKELKEAMVEREAARPSDALGKIAALSSALAAERANGEALMRALQQIIVTEPDEDMDYEMGLTHDAEEMAKIAQGALEEYRKAVAYG